MTKLVNVLTGSML